MSVHVWFFVFLWLMLAGNEAGEYVNRGSSTAGKTRLEEGKRVQAHVFR
jgi:hypothetical protein